MYSEGRSTTQWYRRGKHERSDVENYAPSGEKDDIGIELGSILEFQPRLSEALDLTVALQLDFLLRNELASSSI